MPTFPFSTELLVACSAYAVATVAPGPSNLAIMGIAMRSGRRPALLFALGVVSGSVFWGFLAAFGLSAVLTAWSQALAMLKIAGGLYLSWLALKAARSALSRRAQEDPPSSGTAAGAVQLYLRGAAMHLTNPKAVLAWISIVALALPGHADTALSLVVVATCGALGLLVFCGYALAFSTPFAISAYRSSRRVLEGALALVFGQAAYRLFVSR